MEPSLILASGGLPVEYHVATALFSMVITPTVIANVFLIFIVLRNASFRDLSTMLVTFISIADLLYVIYMCTYIAMQYTVNDVSDAVCTVVITTQSVLRMVPAITFALIGYNWYLAKFRPAVCYRFHQINNIPSKCFLATWVVALAACVGVPFVVCNRFSKAAFLVYSFLSFAGQLTVLTIVVILHCKNLQKTFTELEQENSKVKRTKNTILYFNIKITGAFLFLSVVYFLLSAPLLLYPFFGNGLGVDSTPFAIFFYHIISCFPCLMNPISLYYISQKFQDELRRLFGIEKSKRGKNDKTSPIIPDAYSANRGFFEPRTPAWRQGNEYWNRETIYGEYPSTTPEVKEAPKKKGKKKDVRFCDIVEEVEPKPTESYSSSPTVVKAPTATDEPKSPRLNSPPICTHLREPAQANATPPQRMKNLGGCSRLVSALDLGTRIGTWPHSRPPSSYSNFQEVDLSRLGPSSLLQQNKQFKRNLIKRSKSAYQPRRNEEDVSGNKQGSTETDDAWRRISKTTTRTVQVHIDVCEKEQVLETYL